MNPEIYEAHGILDPGIAIWTDLCIHLRHQSLGIMRTEFALCVVDVTFSVGYQAHYLQKAGIKSVWRKKEAYARVNIAC